MSSSNSAGPTPLLPGYYDDKPEEEHVTVLEVIEPPSVTPMSGVVGQRRGREVMLTLLGNIANDLGGSGLVEPGVRSEHAAAEFMQNLAIRLVQGANWHFGGAKWADDEIRNFRSAALAYLSFCKQVMREHSSLCLFAVKQRQHGQLGDDIPEKNDFSLAADLVTSSSRKYCVYMGALMKKYGRARVSATAVRTFLTEDSDGLEELRHANLIAVPNLGRYMRDDGKGTGTKVPVVKFWILDRAQLCLFRASRYYTGRGRLLERVSTEATIDECHDLSIEQLNMLDHQVEHLDPAHNYGERNTLMEGDVLVNYQLTLKVFNNDPIYKDSFNVIKQGSLGAGSFLLRAYQLAQKGPPGAPMQYVNLVGDYICGLGDARDAVRNISDACFKSYDNDSRKWMARKCDSVKKRLFECINGMRINNPAAVRGHVQTRLNSQTAADAAVGQSMDISAVARLPTAANLHAAKLMSVAQATLQNTSVGQVEVADDTGLVELDAFNDLSNEGRDQPPATLPQEVVSPAPPSSPSAFDAQRGKAAEPVAASSSDKQATDSTDEDVPVTQAPAGSSTPPQRTSTKAQPPSALAAGKRPAEAAAGAPAAKKPSINKDGKLRKKGSGRPKGSLDKKKRKCGGGCPKKPGINKDGTLRKKGSGRPKGSLGKKKRKCGSGCSNDSTN